MRQRILDNLECILAAIMIAAILIATALSPPNQKTTPQTHTEQSQGPPNDTQPTRQYQPELGHDFNEAVDAQIWWEHILEHERQQEQERLQAAVRAAQTAAQQPQQAAATPGGSVWDRLAQCESGGNWHINTGNGFYGGLQFHPTSWRGVGGTGLPHEASREEQIFRAQQLQQVQGFGAWPGCARRLGLL